MVVVLCEEAESDSCYRVVTPTQVECFEETPVLLWCVCVCVCTRERERDSMLGL